MGAMTCRRWLVERLNSLTPGGFLVLAVILLLILVAIYEQLHPEERLRREAEYRVNAEKKEAERKAQVEAEQERAAQEALEKFQKHCDELRDKKIVDLTTRDVNELRDCGEKAPAFMPRVPR